MKPYRPPYLIQRINRALHQDELPAGLAAKYQANQERTPEERTYINGLMPLDYMGSAEFEFGVFGDSLREIVNDRTNYRRFKLLVTGTADNSWPRHFPVKEQTVELFGFAHTDHVAQAKADIALFAADKFTGRTKERVCLREGCFGKISSTHYRDGKRLRKPVVSLKESEHAAWFELGNLWMVGTDEWQMDRIAELLGVPVN